VPGIWAHAARSLGAGGSFVRGARGIVCKLQTDRRSDSRYYQWGMLGGVVGAFVVAVLFLILDLAAGRSFATPTARTIARAR
jgi:hypothetical protein